MLVLVLVLRAGAGSRPGGRGTCSLLRQRKVPKRKATLQSATPSRCYGANLRRGGCGVRRGTRYALARCARTTTASQITKHAREGAHATPQPPRRRRSQKGVGSQTAKQPHGPSLRSAQSAQRVALAPGRFGPSAAMARVGVRLRVPSGCAEERSGQRIRARDCLSEASSSETPLDASTAGCPQRSEGTQPAGSLFLGLLSFGEAKESESPAGARPGPRTRQRHTTSYKNNSY